MIKENKWTLDFPDVLHDVHGNHPMPLVNSRCPGRLSPVQSVHA